MVQVWPPRSGPLTAQTWTWKFGSSSAFTGLDPWTSCQVRSWTWVWKGQDWTPDSLVRGDIFALALNLGGQIQIITLWQLKIFLGKPTLAKLFFFHLSTMPCKHDCPDPNLIIQDAHCVQPSKRGLGNDYPVTPLEELRERDKCKWIIVKKRAFDTYSTTTVLMTQMHTSYLTVSPVPLLQNLVLKHEHIVLDLVMKLAYLEAVWENKYIEIGRKCLKEQVYLYVVYEYWVCLIVSFSFLSIRPSMKLHRRKQWLHMTTSNHLKYVSY